MKFDKILNIIFKIRDERDKKSFDKRLRRLE